MTKTVLVIFACLLAVGAPAWGQAVKPETAEAKAAMQRAQRLAANPMKIILQAGKIRRKGDAEPPAEPPADAANLRRTVARANEAVAPLPSAPATAEASPRSAAVAALAPAPVPAAAPAPAPEAQPRLLPLAPLPAAAAAATVPALQAAPTAIDSPPVIEKALPPQAVPVAAMSLRPTLVNMVEPNIPVRLLNESGGVSEVMVDLSLRPDGSVGEVSLASPLPRSWRSYIMAALQQWRFEPLPSAQVHRVQLIFNER